MELKNIFSQDVANVLIEKGHKAVRIDQTPNRRPIFCFEQTETLDADLDEVFGPKRITVADPSTVKRLLKEGFHIVDIKPDRFNREKTVFLFEDSEEFQKALGSAAEKPTEGDDEKVLKEA